MVKKLFNTIGLAIIILITCLLTTKIEKEINIVEKTLKDVTTTIEHYYPNLKPIENNNSKPISNLSSSEETTNISDLKTIFNDLDVQAKRELNNIAREYLEVKEMLNNIYNGNRNITSYKTANNLSYLSDSLGRLLLYSGVPSIATSVIKGSIITVEVVAKMRFLWPFIKAGIILAALVATVVVVVMYWENIEPIFLELSNIYFKAAIGFFGIVNNIINRIKNATRAKGKNKELTLTKAQQEAILRRKDKIEGEMCYQIAYISEDNEVVNTGNKLTYLEAFCYIKWLVINLEAKKQRKAKWLDKYDLLPKEPKNANKIKPNLFGVSTELMSYAGALAYKTGLNNLTTYHRHGDGNGYKPHFHDLSHAIHIWFDVFD